MAAASAAKKTLGQRWDSFWSGVGRVKNGAQAAVTDFRTNSDGVDHFRARWEDEQPALGKWAKNEYPDQVFGKFGERGVREAKQGVRSLLGTTDASLKSVTAAQVKGLEEGTQSQLMRGVEEIRAQKGALGPSMRSAATNMLKRVGVDAPHWLTNPHAGAEEAKIAKTVNQALKGGDKVGIIQRVASKPFRVAANHPGAALALTGAALIYGGYSLFKGREEKNAAAEQEATQMALQQSMMRSPYMNSVTPQESALLDARMRDSSNGGVSMSDRVMSDRAAAQAAGAPVAG